jgi:hypothetical protein
MSADISLRLSSKLFFWLPPLVSASIFVKEVFHTFISGSNERIKRALRQPLFPKNNDIQYFTLGSVLSNIYVMLLVQLLKDGRIDFVV